MVEFGDGKVGRTTPDIKAVLSILSYKLTGILSLQFFIIMCLFRLLLCTHARLYSTAEYKHIVHNLNGLKITDAN